MIAGSGVRDGKNCTIQSITPVDGGNNIVFAWTQDDGTAATQTLFVADGVDGTNGVDGRDGADGVSVTHNWNGTILEVTSASGTTSADLKGETGAQGAQGLKGDKGDTGAQGAQGIQGEKGEDGYPFLIYKEYADVSEFNAADFPEIGLMFMINDGVTGSDKPVYRYTGDADNPYTHITDMSTAEGLKGEKGDKGDQGEQGVAGSNGVDGADGTTYTPEIGTITTVDSTQQAAASVEIDEATARAIFNFSIPKGETGQDGADAPQIDDATAAADTTWSSSKIDDEKLTKKNHIAMTSLGFTVGSTVSVAEFLGALATRFGTHAYINTGWENAKAANVSDGATTIVVGGGLLLFSTNSASFPNASWSWAEAIYFPIDKGNATVYKIMGRTEGTSGTLNFSKIFAYEAKGVANVAPTSVTLAGGVTQVSISGNVDNFYEVVNGICYFQIYLIVREKTTEYFTAISGLPKPKVNVFFSTAPFANGTETMRANVQPSGNLRISHGDVDGMYMLTGSYPVAT